MNRWANGSRDERYMNFFFFTYRLFVLFIFKTGSHSVAYVNYVNQAGPKLS